MKLPSKRKTLIAGSTAAAVAAVTVPVAMAFADETAYQEEYCSVLSMEPPEGTNSSEGVAVANGGNYFVGMADDQPMAWIDGGEPREIDLESFTVVDVNAEGLVAGFQADPETGADKALIYDLETEETTELQGDPEAERSVVPTAINDNGDVVGSIAEPGIPLKWEAGSTEPTELERDDDSESHVADINEDGVAVGTQTADGTDQAWMWDTDGSGSQLPESSAGGEEAIAVNGEWALSAPTEDGTQYRWDLTTGEQPQAVEISSATDVDEQGRVFGTTTEDGVELPARQDDEGITVLETLADEPVEEQAHQILDVSADGDDMTGLSTTDDGTVSAAEWGCTS